jgi:cytoskeletal protein RodZ
MPEQPTHSSILKDNREAKGLTLELVHEATKIPLDALKAIEQGYSVRSLTPFYYRGFIKIYAEFLGLDYQEVFKAFNLHKSAAVPVTPSTKTAPVKTAGLLAKPPKKSKPRVVKPIEDFMAGLWTGKNRNLALRFLGVLIAIFVLVKFVGCVANNIKMKPKAKASASVKSKASKPQPIVVPEETQPAAQAADAGAQQKGTQQSVKAQSASHKVELTVRAIKDSWIQVKADGKTVFSMTMRKGTMESWSANNQIEVSGRNISELDMEVNGKHIGTLGSSERRAKRVIITKEGLNVKK